MQCNAKLPDLGADLARKAGIEAKNKAETAVLSLCEGESAGCVVLQLQLCLSLCSAVLRRMCTRALPRAGFGCIGCS